MIDIISERLFLSALAKIRVSLAKLMKWIMVPLGLSLMQIRFFAFCDSRCSFLAKDSIAIKKMYGDRGHP